MAVEEEEEEEGALDEARLERRLEKRLDGAGRFDRREPERFVDFEAELPPGVEPGASAMAHTPSGDMVRLATPYRAAGEGANVPSPLSSHFSLAPSAPPRCASRYLTDSRTHVLSRCVSHSRLRRAAAARRRCGAVRRHIKSRWLSL